MEVVCLSEKNAYLLHIDLDVFLEVVAVKIQNQVMDKVEAITYDDQRELVCQFGLLFKK